ncbi:purpurin-like [Trematomus bernacchii]|uniref:purpurin-like n=1 Tax=Trematomus bernacchii TaxID=40690 RepID=UPI00146BEE48|nr:purpurin-like [Trematomus bernacchii]
MVAASKGRVTLFGWVFKWWKVIKYFHPRTILKYNFKALLQKCNFSLFCSRFWVVCADMAAQYSVPDPASPGKMFMNYQGLASYLSSGGDNYWIIDTDYENYALTYACRTLMDDGTCDDGYSLLFSRNPRGLPPAIQRIVRQKQEEICLVGEFQPVLQTGAC